MKSNVKGYSNWYGDRMVNENKDKEFGQEGEGKFGLIVCSETVWRDGVRVSSGRCYSNRGETQPSRGTYDEHIYYSPSEFEGWESDPAFSEYDTRGLRFTWAELSPNNTPICILVPGTGDRFHNRSPLFVEYQKVYLDLVSIPEFSQILKAKEQGTLGKIPKEIIMNLKGKSNSLEIDQRTQDIFADETHHMTRLTKAAVKKSWKMGLI